MCFKNNFLRSQASRQPTGEVRVNPGSGGLESNSESSLDYGLHLFRGQLICSWKSLLDNCEWRPKVQITGACSWGKDYSINSKWYLHCKVSTLKLSVCTEGEFSCASGDCIRMEERCDQVGDAAQLDYLCSVFDISSDRHPVIRKTVARQCATGWNIHQKFSVTRSSTVQMALMRWGDIKTY